MFICNVATDIYGKKHNIRLRMPQTPTYEELVRYIECHFDIVVRSTRPEGYLDISFKVKVIKLFDSIMSKWVDLYNAAQLTHGCQLYAFQPENNWHSDMQGALPKAHSVVTWQSAYKDARRKRALRADRDCDTPPSRAAKMRSVFGDLDIGSKGYVILSDLKAAMKALDINVTEGTTPALFRKADRSCDGHLNFEEFSRFAVQHPNLLDALFFRSRPVWNNATAKIAANEELLALRRQREREIERVRDKRAQWEQRTHLEKVLETQRKAAKLARLQAEISTIKEHTALDDLYYNTNPERGNQAEDVPSLM
eukprot:TRINITY_DN21843_c0_g1_i1.p1 TRINITY_DN21843_c0_g1~~TRINITY_DN21843_c0_g1_i1.p1  ORF type:complete len:310 (+),score=54.83 TRINITY_DN21843_c0_g1_i1:133-1062(+)